MSAEPRVVRVVEREGEGYRLVGSLVWAWVLWELVDRVDWSTVEELFRLWIASGGAS